MEIVNRKAKYEYHFVQKYEAGMQLVGTEVKALRAGEASITDAWCFFKGDELYVKNLHISPYKHGPDTQHDPERVRKLLLKKVELRKIQRASTQKGLTIIPYKIYFSESGYAKCQIVVAQGKQAHDKRQTIKERDIKRDLDRIKRI